MLDIIDPLKFESKSVQVPPKDSLPQAHKTTTSKLVQVAGKSVQVAGKSVQVTGKSVQVTGKSVQVNLIFPLYINALHTPKQETGNK